MTPEQISAIVLKKLAQMANSRAHGRAAAKRVVISYPVYFNQSQLNGTKKAAEIAELDVIAYVFKMDYSI